MRVCTTLPHRTLLRMRTSPILRVNTNRSGHPIGLFAYFRPLMLFFSTCHYKWPIAKSYQLQSYNFIYKNWLIRNINSCFFLKISKSGSDWCCPYAIELQKWPGHALIFILELERENTKFFLEYVIPGVILERKWGWERELKYRINIQQCWTGQSGEPLNWALNCNYSCHSVCLPCHLALSRVNRILVIEWSHGRDGLRSSRKVSWYMSRCRIQLSGESVLLVNPEEVVQGGMRCRWRSCCCFESWCTSDRGEAFFGLSTIRKVLDQSTHKPNPAGSPERSSQKFLSH